MKTRYLTTAPAITRKLNMLKDLLSNTLINHHDQYNRRNMGITVVDFGYCYRVLVDKKGQMTDPNFIRHVIVVAGLIAAGYFLIVWRPKRN